MAATRAKSSQRSAKTTAKTTAKTSSTASKKKKIAADAKPGKAKVVRAKKSTPKSAPAEHPALLKVIQSALDDLKAVDVRVLDVRDITDIADVMVIASGNSDRHVRSIAERVVEYVKKSGRRPAGVEGDRDGEWVLVDMHDVIVHIMLPRVREFYRLESLWDVSAARREAG